MSETTPESPAAAQCNDRRRGRIPAATTVITILAAGIGCVADRRSAVDGSACLRHRPAMTGSAPAPWGGRSLPAVRVQVRTFTTLSDITDGTDIAHLVIDDRTLKLRGTKPIPWMSPRSLTTPQNAAMEGHSAMDSAHESETFGDTTESVVSCTPPRYATDRGEVGWEEDWGYVSVGPVDTEDADSALTVSVDLDDVDDGMPPEVARRLAAVIAAACDAADGTPLGWTQYRAESPALGEPDPHNAGMVVVGPGYSEGPTMLAETFDLGCVRDFYTDKRGESRSATIYRRTFRTLAEVTPWEPITGDDLAGILAHQRLCEVS